MPNQLGKRYTCEACGAVYLVVKQGEGTIECHGQPATQQAAKQLPSSD
jgi:desulfoferrodoxin-like iron-binding protein